MDLARKYHEKYLKDRRSFVPKPQNQPNTSANAYTDSNVNYKAKKFCRFT